MRRVNVVDKCRRWGVGGNFASVFIRDFLGSIDGHCIIRPGVPSRAQILLTQALRLKIRNYNFTPHQAIYSGITRTNFPVDLDCWIICRRNCTGLVMTHSGKSNLVLFFYTWCRSSVIDVLRRLIFWDRMGSGAFYVVWSQAIATNISFGLK